MKHLMLVWLTVLSLVVLVVAASITFHDEASDSVLRPAAQALDLVESPCPGGFSHSSIADHAVVDTCTGKHDGKTLTVVLYPRSKFANYGQYTDDPNSPLFKCHDIPGWPESRCVNE